MLVLGLDPGTATTGYGFIKTAGTEMEALNWGLIETDKNNNPSHRLVNIFRQMDKLILKYSPDLVAIEKVFFARNAKTAIRVGQAQGVMLYCAANHKLEVFEYAPATIKKLITGNGRADKKLMQKSVRKILGNHIKSKKHKKTHFDNAADALAIAMTHAISINGKEEK